MMPTKNNDDTALSMTRVSEKELFFVDETKNHQQRRRVDLFVSTAGQKIMTMMIMIPHQGPTKR